VPSRRVVAGGAQELLSQTVRLSEHTWVGQPHVGPIDAQISAHGEPAAAQLNSDGSLRWVETRRKVAPGQAVVFYVKDAVIGGATAG